MSHFPVFHQMEAVRVFTPDELKKRPEGMSETDYVVADMKQALEGMIKS